MIICDVAKAGSGITTARGGSGGSGVAGGSIPPPELAALAEGGAWGAVYDALKGPCMARAATLQSSTSGGKKGEVPSLADLTACLDNMARCVEVCILRGRGGGRRCLPFRALELYSPR